MPQDEVEAAVERARFLASGQSDPHSATITELCDALTRIARHILMPVKP